eukprot:XP_766250.1 chaperone protein DnaJ [Theileria parva strain Muguga]
MKNYYSILGVAKNASRTDIRKAYLQKAKLYHPDLNSSPSAPSKFKEIQEAYNTLYDANRRKEYDSATIFGPSSRTGQAYRYNVNREYRNYTETPYENDSFESQFKAEAQRLRREWEQMEEKFREWTMEEDVSYIKILERYLIAEFTILVSIYYKKDHLNKTINSHKPY